MTNFKMIAEHRDALGRELNVGDIVITLDSNYRSGGSFEVGVVAGSTAKLVKVASPSWRKDAAPTISNRHVDKLIIIREDDIQLDRVKERLFTIRDQLISVGLDTYNL